MNDQSQLASFIESVEKFFSERDAHSEEKDFERQNVRRLQSLFSAICSGDLEAFAEHLSEDVCFRIVGAPDFPLTRAAQNRESAKELVLNNFSQLEKQTPELISVVAQGDLVVVRGKEVGRIKGAFNDYRLNWVQEYTFENEKITGFVQFLDDLELLDK